MINLFSGTPGAGKTCMALTYMTQQTKEGRKLFVHGIPHLKIPHVDVYCDAPNCDVCTTFTEEDKQSMHKANEWHEWAPDGAVLFFDEVQNVYRPRSSGSKPPASIQAFEVHRHRGLDFYLISQSPKLFDSNIRELISRHIHLKANWAGRFQYEWPECKLNVQSTSDAVRSSYKLNKKMFDLYSSASVHTKQKRKMPIAVYVFLGLVITIGYFGFNTYDRINSAISGDVIEPADDALASSAVKPANDSVKTNLINTSNYLPSQYDFKPIVRGKIETAPAYSELVKVKDFPRNVGCISNSDSCTCYTQQLTIYPTTLQQCLAQIDRKPESFNPYHEAEKEVQYKLLKPKDANV